jgi:hypothetical protein
MHLGIVDRSFVPLIGIVPSFISRGTPHHAARDTSISEGRKLNIRIMPAARNEPQLLGSFTCPKIGTWDRLTSPPKEGMLRIFYIRKIRRLRPGLNPRTREPEASMLTSRSPKSLSYSCYSLMLEAESASGIMSMKNFNDITGNRTRYLSACSTVPQALAPPRTFFGKV